MSDKSESEFISFTKLLGTPIRRFYAHRDLIRVLAVRELTARYRQSFFGGLWSVLQPIAIVTLFYYVFGVVFQTKWGGAQTGSTVFIFAMFIGLLVYNIFAEAVGRSVTIISGNQNYVTKIAFPLAVLPIVQVVYSIVNFSIGFGIIFVFGAIVGIVQISWNLLILPFLIFPVVLWSAGISWIVASLNVYFRDTSIVVPLFLQLLLFLSPVFYAIELVPENIRLILLFSPLSEPITAIRNILMSGSIPEIQDLAFGFGTSIFVFLAGYAFFRKTARGFADIL